MESLFFFSQYFFCSFSEPRRSEFRFLELTMPTVAQRRIAAERRSAAEKVKKQLKPAKVAKKLSKAEKRAAKAGQQLKVLQPEPCRA